MARRQRGELPTPGGKQYAATDQQCPGARSNDGRKCSINFALGFGIQAQEVTPESARRRLYVPRFAFESRRIWITEPGNGGWRRDQLMQQLQPLRYFRLSLKAHAGYIAARPAEVGHEAGCNWIAAADEHDRYGRGGSHCRARGDILPKNHATCRRTRSAASAGSRSNLFSAQRNSIATLWPSMNPASFRPSRNADTR